MKNIIFENVTKFYKNEKILENFNLEIPSESFFALLGPSGSGKTTVLRLIAGLEFVDKGKIFLGKENITFLPANERKINTVFQNYALFPHLNVFENIAYGLKIKNENSIEIKKKIEKIAESFDMSKYLFKEIKELSGGQQQRVAVARAIINNPNVLLLDEPLSALDIKLREKMLSELSDLQDKLKTTFVYITHDQFEALAVADYMAIMNYNGEIEQIGKPKEIYDNPKTKFVAEFIGNTNIINGFLKKINNEFHFTVYKIGEYKVNLKKNNYNDNYECFLSIRPENLIIKKNNEINENLQNNFIYGKITGIIFYGHTIEYKVLTPLGNLKVLDSKKENNNINYEDQVYLYWDPKNAIFLEK